LQPVLEPVSPYPALLLRGSEDRILVIADLHIGWEVALSQQGIHIPSQTAKLVDKLERIVRTASPTELIVVGDVKHAIAKVELEEWRDVPEFFEKAMKLVPIVKVLPGNHDGNLEPLIPRDITILPVSGTRLLKHVAVLHGHAWPSPELFGCATLVMSHSHPVVVFSDPLGLRVVSQVWIKAECDPVNLARSFLKHLNVKIERPAEIEFRERFNTEPKISKCIIMPTFNDYIGGQSVNRKATWNRSKLKEEYIGPVLRSKSVDMENAEVHMLDGTFLGRISQLRSFA
jgi:putative SbcD/Mre11-related phosphoesterase